MITTSFGTYAIFIVLVNNITLFNSTATMVVAFSSPTFFLNLGLVVGTNFIIDFITYCGFMLFNNSLSHMMIHIIKENGALNKDMDLPLLIVNYINLYNHNVIASRVSRVEGKSIKRVTHVEKLEQLNNSNSSNKDFLKNKAKSVAVENLRSNNLERDITKPEIRHKTGNIPPRNNLVSFQ